MLIGILVAGHAAERIQEKHGDYDALFQQLLEGQDFSYRVFNVVDMEFPESVSDCDGWLITGSKHGVYEDHPFIRPLEAFIRSARDAGVPMVGICFGHQIVARALGGRVEKFEGGWSVGRTTYVTDSGPITLNAWHQDQVIEPPAGARTVGRTEFCAHAILDYPGGILTIQAHPELSPEVLNDLIETRGKAAGVPQELLNAARERTAFSGDEPKAADMIGRHFRAHARKEVADV